MAIPGSKLAASLSKLQALQAGGRRVFESDELQRVHRERLRKHGFLRSVIKGWLIASSPGAEPGDSTPWYASFWEFCARYCEGRFGKDWYLSPEQSLLLHSENTIIPAQVIVYSPKGTNNTLTLLFGTSLYDLKQKQKPPEGDLTVKDGLRLYVPAAALIKVPEDFFTRHPVEAQVALAAIRDPSELLGRLLDGGHSAVAGRLAGAFRRIGRQDFAGEIVKTMKGAGYDVRESDPFTSGHAFTTLVRGVAPIVGRIQALWTSLREAAADGFPQAPGLPDDKDAYLRFVDDIYQSDAYHSLSIEGYRVTPELIERVRAGNWNPTENDDDRKNKDALAARGYWQAFQQVKETVAKIIGGSEPGVLVRATHRDWYRELFAPSVAAGLIGPGALAGYRSHPVFLRGSRHMPPRAEVLADAMPALFDLLESEKEPSVRAVLGHWLFGYIHPYPDGNGRMARFLMNAMLASGGYPWTVIRVEDRSAYLKALETASIDGDIRSFASFIAERVRWSMEQAGTQAA
ncbi:MAG: Fic family protein [Xanthobacteraceae bacterium]|nr:Fic family protein [Xanthobacteraceae bacterium]PWB61312.1 MAG: cell filamentation protein Fic [Bradyrhizobiaceae bacterium]